LGQIALKIADKLSTKTAGHLVIIATPADVGIIVQWRSVLGQAALLHRRANAVTSAIERISVPHYSKPAAKKSAPALGGAFIASPSDVTTLIQTLASISAVNQSFAPSSGALGDQPLMNLLAPRLTANHVYIPSVYPPNLLTRPDLGDTFVGNAIGTLEDDRAKVNADIALYTQAITDAQAVSSGGADYTDSDKASANGFLNLTTGINSEIQVLGSTVSAIDSFEAALLTGQTATPTNNSTAQPTSTPSPALPGAIPAPPIAASSNPPAQAQMPATGQGNNAPTGTTLQQILVADLLAHQVWGGTNAPDDNVLQEIQILSIHTLESGGEMLTTSNLFLGSRIKFGGGVVATFALYGVTGEVESGGVAYGYEGPIGEKEVVCELRSGSRVNAQLAGEETTMEKKN
jgi:hypothetical protein